jgi:hypothetical protein
MKFYVEWKDAYNPYDPWIKDPQYNFKSLQKAVEHCLDSVDIYKTLEHRIRMKRKGHKAVTMATFLPLPEEDSL